MMRPRRRVRGRLRAAMAAAVVLALLGSVQVIRAGASPQASVTFYSGPIGITKDDVVRVNVTNLNTTTRQASVTVVDEKGTTKGKKMLTLAPGQTDFFDLTLNGLVGRLMVRTQAQCSSNLFLVSTEIYDAATQQTNATLAEYGVLTVNQGAHILFSAMGVTDAETARISVTNVGSVTADLTVNFMEEDGKIIQSSVLSVAPKQTGFADINGDGLAGTVLRGDLTVNGDGLKVLTAMEVFDTSTGRTNNFEIQQLTM